MSASIPIPTRPRPAAPTLVLPSEVASLPAARHPWSAALVRRTTHPKIAATSAHNPDSISGSGGLGGMNLDLNEGEIMRHDDDVLVGDDNAVGQPTSWPPRPRLKLVSRSAVRWISEHEVAGGVDAAAKFRPDFSQVASAVDTVREGFVSGRAGIERPPRESVSGTYFFKRVESRPSMGGKVTAVFKPADEEPTNGSSPCGSLISPSSSPRHPPGGSIPRSSPDWRDSSRSAQMLAAGFRPGDGVYKEVAAYLLDHSNFAKVPQTALAECNFVDSETRQLRTKMGAFQVYVPNVGDADDWGPGIFPTEDVHRIAILDIRILNFDRHGGNILVTKSASGRHGLVPIDHAFALPENILAVPWAVWMDWPAAREPISAATKSYIAGLEPDIEARMLQDELGENIRTSSTRALKIATRLLQKGAAAGLTLHDIGLLIYTREGEESDDQKSELQKIVDEAIESSKLRQSHIGDDWEDLPSSGLFTLEGESPACSPVSRPNESHVEEHIIKYACRQMDELIMRITARKKGSGGHPGGHLGRARSIPDFGFRLGASAAGSEMCTSLPFTPFVPTQSTIADSNPTPLLSMITSVAASPSGSVNNVDRFPAGLGPFPPSNVMVDVTNGISRKIEVVAPVPCPPSGNAVHHFSIGQGSRPPKMNCPVVARKASPVSPHEFDWDSAFSSS
jgi:hypothetical protein